MSRVLVTGSADGLGRLAAMQLVADGHEVMLHARGVTNVSLHVGSAAAMPFEKRCPEALFHQSNSFACRRRVMPARSAPCLIDHEQEAHGRFHWRPRLRYCLRAV